MANPLVKFNIRAQVSIFPQRIQQMVDQPNGPVSEIVRQRAEQVLSAGKQMLSGRRYANHHPGAGSIANTGQVTPGSGSAWIVVFTHPKAFLVHSGAGAHPIGGPGKILFRGGPQPVDRHGNKRFYRKTAVFHPGFTGIPFLTDPARAAGLKPSGALKRGRQGPFPLFR